MDCFLFYAARAGDNDEETSYVHLDQPKYWLPEVSNVFHGRDVFAPVAAHLASGVPFNIAWHSDY